MKTCETCKHWEERASGNGECHAVESSGSMWIGGPYDGQPVLITNEKFGCKAYEEDDA